MVNQTFSDILVIENLPEWCTTNKLYQLFCNDKNQNKLNVAWIHHESTEVAYLCFTSSIDAYKTILKYNNTFLSFSKLYADEIRSGCFVNGYEEQKIKINLKHVKSFIFHRINEMLKSPTLTQSYETAKSCLLFVQASCKLTNTEWWQLFPTAFDIYKTVDSPKAFVQFRTKEDAYEAGQYIDRHTFTFQIRGVLTNVFVCCCFTTEKFAKQKVKLHLLQSHSSLFEVDNSPDKLYTRVVDYLYS